MIWYPYEQMKTMRAPYEIVDAEGVYLYTREKKLIDSVSSWWPYHGPSQTCMLSCILSSWFDSPSVPTMQCTTSSVTPTLS